MWYSKFEEKYYSSKKKRSFFEVFISKIKEKINVLKENPRLYPVIHNNDIVRSFYIRSLAFSYIIDDNNKLITITEAVFIKSSLKLKVK